MNGDSSPADHGPDAGRDSQPSSTEMIRLARNRMDLRHRLMDLGVTVLECDCGRMAPDDAPDGAGGGLSVACGFTMKPGRNAPDSEHDLFRIMDYVLAVIAMLRPEACAAPPGSRTLFLWYVDPNCTGIYGDALDCPYEEEHGGTGASGLH